MCGIVAAVTPRDLDFGVLALMRDRLTHRGPDRGSSWTAPTGRGVVSFGHRRLSIIDLTSRADQPMVLDDGSLALVYNGEIYNYVELARELAAAGETFRSRSDTEVLLKAYATWGHDCLPRLNGMFAFAIWDARRHELFVARDRFGEKPLFYVELPGGGVAFASEMKALFAHPSLTARPHAATVDAYVGGTYYEEGEQTMFHGVKRVPPAHALVVDAEGRIARTWRYWLPDYAPREAFSDDTITTFRDLLERSVRLRLRADVPVGTSLSGGLDSSAIVGVLSRLRTQGEAETFQQNTFSGRFDGIDAALNEGPDIDRVVEMTGVNSFAVTPDPDSLAAECELLHWHQEEPFLSASIYMQWCVMRLAAEHDTTVLLDGQGADELLAGYQYYFRSHQLDLLDRGRLRAFALETRSFTRRLERAARAFPESRRRFDEHIAFGYVEAALRWRLGLYAGPYTEGVPPATRGNRLRRQIAEGLQYNSLPALLRYADRNAMAFSRETRLPFLDHELVDWVISLPNDAFIRGGWQKYILRRSVEGLIPREIQWRADKVGYAAPLDHWLRGPLRGWAEMRLFSGRIVDLDQYDRHSLETLWNDHQRGAADNSWALWRWISLNEWFALIDGGRWPSKSAAQSQDRATSRVS